MLSTHPTSRQVFHNTVIGSHCVLSVRITSTFHTQLTLHSLVSSRPKKNYTQYNTLIIQQNKSHETKGCPYHMTKGNKTKNGADQEIRQRKNFWTLSEMLDFKEQGNVAHVHTGTIYRKSRNFHFQNFSRVQVSCENIIVCRTISYIFIHRTLMFE